MICPTCGKAQLTERPHVHRTPPESRLPRTAAGRASVQLKDEIPVALWEQLEMVSRSCGYVGDYLATIREAGYAILPWRADTFDGSLDVLRELVRVLSAEPLRTFGRKDNGAAWSDWFNDEFIPAWVLAQRTVGASNG